MLDSKTLIFTRGEFSKLIWEFNTEDMENLKLSDSELDDLYSKMIAYYQYMLITNEISIKEFRENLVDLIWEFAYDEFESNEDWIGLAKSTEEDLIWNVRSCFAYVVENYFESNADY